MCIRDRALPFAIAAAETLADAGHRARYAYQLGHTLMRSDEYAAAKRWFAAAAGDFAQAGDVLALAQIDIDLCDIALQQEHLGEVAPLLARAQPAMGWAGDLRLAARVDLKVGDKVVSSRNADCSRSATSCPASRSAYRKAPRPIPKARTAVAGA